MTNRQEVSIANGRGGGLPAQAASYDRTDAASQSSSSVDSGSNNQQNDKAKKPKKIKAFFSLGRNKEQRKNREDHENSQNQEQDRRIAKASQGKIRQSHSIPRIKDGALSIQGEQRYDVAGAEQRYGAHAVSKSVGSRDDMDATTARQSRRTGETQPPRAAGGESNSRTDIYTQNGSNGHANTTGDANGVARYSSLRAIGMVNHGNSCFMNAVVQCLRHTNELARYFALALYRQHMQAHSSRSSSGKSSKKQARAFELSDTFATLIGALWRADYVSADSLKLKTVAGRLCEQYRSSTQQDAQEFLLWLLDALDDELRPAVSKSNAGGSQKSGDAKTKGAGIDEESSYSSRPKRGSKFVDANLELVHEYRRNQSEILRQVAGFYESTLTCPVCSKTSVTYEPFTCLSLPLAQRNIYVVDVIFTRPPTQFAAVRSTTCKSDVAIYQVRVACQISTVETLRTLKSNLFAMPSLGLRPDQPLLLVNIPSTLNWVISLSDSGKLGDLAHTHLHAFVLETASMQSNSNANLIDTTASRAGAGLGNDEQRLALVVLNVERYKEGPNNQAFLRQWTRPLALCNVERTICYWELLTSVINALISLREPRGTKSKKLPLHSVKSLLEEFRAGLSVYVIEDDQNVWKPLASTLDMPLLSETIDRLIAATSSAQAGTDGIPHLKLVVEWESTTRMTCLFHLATAAGCTSTVQPEEEMVLGLFEDPSLSQLLPSNTPNGTVSGTQKAFGQVGATSLIECLKMNFREEQLGHDDAWMCPQCKRLQAGTMKKLSLWTVADLFIVHLKRFRHAEGKRAKLDCFVDFPLDGLDMSAFSSGNRIQDSESVVSNGDKLNGLHERESQSRNSTTSEAAANGAHPGTEQQSPSESESDDDEGASASSEYENVKIHHSRTDKQQKDVPLRHDSASRRLPDDHSNDSARLIYDLVAVVNHYGTLQSGHYTAFCRYPRNGVGNTDANSDLWFSFDDHTVTYKRADEVRTSAAYLLFYQRRNAHNNDAVHWSAMLPSRNALTASSHSIASMTVRDESKKRSGSTDSLKQPPDASLEIPLATDPSVASATRVHSHSHSDTPSKLPETNAIKPVVKNLKPVVQNTTERARAPPPDLPLSERTNATKQQPAASKTPAPATQTGRQMRPAPSLPPAATGPSPTPASANSTVSPATTQSGVHMPKSIFPLNQNATQPSLVSQQTRPSTSQQRHEQQYVTEPQPPPGKTVATSRAYDSTKYEDNPALGSVYASDYPQPHISFVNIPVTATTSHAESTPPAFTQSAVDAPAAPSTVPANPSSIGGTAPSVKTTANAQPTQSKPPRYKNGMLVEETTEKPATPQYIYSQVSSGSSNSNEKPPVVNELVFARFGAMRTAHKS